MKDNFLIAVNKPIGMTSFDVVFKLKKTLNLSRKKKIGHLGTLDPFASGLLLIAFGNACKLMDLGTKVFKIYRAIGIHGQKSETGDVEGCISKTMKSISLDDLKKDSSLYANEMLGEYFQVPPYYSAVKHQGKPLYTWAREGIFIKKDPVKRQLYSFEILDFKSNTIEFNCCVSSGTYIRTLFEDYCAKFKNIGYLKNLKRTQIGQFCLSKAGELEKITLDNIEHFAIDYQEVFKFPDLKFSQIDCIKFSQGKMIDFNVYTKKAGSYWIKDIYNQYLAFVELNFEKSNTIASFYTNDTDDTKKLIIAKRISLGLFELKN